MKDLNNKKVIVTGATGGIGRSIVKSLSENGALVLATGTKNEKLDKLKAEFRNVEILKFDISDTSKIEDYGKLFLTVKPENYKKNYILELINVKGELIRKTKNNLENFYTLEYLPPGEYQIRIIKDANGNGKWDTGNYLKKIQPEEVKYLKESIIVRANWELNETIGI